MALMGHRSGQPVNIARVLIHDVKMRKMRRGKMRLTSTRYVQCCLSRRSPLGPGSGVRVCASSEV